MSNEFKDIFGEWRPEDSLLNSEKEERSERSQRQQQLKQVDVVNVYEGVMNYGTGIATKAETFVLLKDYRGRELRIFVMRDIAYSISLALSNNLPDRPLTHDLMKTLLDKVKATITEVIIDDLWQNVFYAKIRLASGDQAWEIDARPSDALALALRFRAPIYVADDVLEAAQGE